MTFGPWRRYLLPSPVLATNSLVEGSGHGIWIDSTWLNPALDYFSQAPTMFLRCPATSFAPVEFTVDWLGSTQTSGGPMYYTTKTVRIGSHLYRAAAKVFGDSEDPHLVLVDVDDTDGTITLLQSPNDETRPGMCIEGSDGNLWLMSEDVVPSIAHVNRVTPDGTWTTYDLTLQGFPSEAVYQQLGIGQGGDYVYVILATVDDAYNLCSIATDGSATVLTPLTSDLPSGNCLPTLVFFGPDGNVWVGFFTYIEGGGDWGFLVYDTEGALQDTFLGPTAPDPAVGFYISNIIKYDDETIAFCGWWFPDGDPDAGWLDTLGASVFAVDMSGTYTEHVLVAVDGDEGGNISTPTDLMLHSVTGEVWVTDMGTYTVFPLHPGAVWAPKSSGWTVGAIPVQ